tara:strand:+ start:393 stop:1043 length:651 start_codon:yes stop_codon:yes gene_type:complete
MENILKENRVPENAIFNIVEYSRDKKLSSRRFKKNLEVNYFLKMFQKFDKIIKKGKLEKMRLETEFMEYTDTNTLTIDEYEEKEDEFYENINNVYSPSMHNLIYDYINDDIDNAILMWSNILRIMRKNELLEKFNDLKILKPNDSPFITHYQYKETECEICDNYNSFKEWLDLIRFNIIPVLKNQIYQDYGPEEWNYDYFQDSGDESDESEIIVEF